MNQTSRQTRKARREAERAQRKAEYKLARTQQAAEPSSQTSTYADVPAKAVRMERQVGQEIAEEEITGDEQARERNYTARNRANALHSTGPTSDTGKKTSSQNAFKHGLYSKQVVIPGEDAAAFEALRDDLRRDNQPINTTEEILVNELAENFWRIRRMRAYEASSLGSDQNISLKQLALILRMMGAAERAFHKAQAALAKLQKARGFVPQQSEHSAEDRSAAADRSGFVPSKCTPPDPDPCQQAARSVFQPTNPDGFVPENSAETEDQAA